MARKQIEITITDEGRDRGKTFQITEMPATEAQEIATQLLVAALNCGMELKGDVFNMGMADLWQAGFSVIEQVPYHFLKPILDRFDRCAMYLDKQTNFARKLADGDIEEVKTFFKLRAAAIKLHFDFFDLGGGLTSGQPQENQTTA